MKNLTKVLAMICLLLPLGLQAQNGEVTGVVNDPSGKGVPFAVVVLMKNNAEVLSTLTEYDGSYTLGNIPPGTYDILIDASCCHEFTLTGVQIGNRQQIHRNFNLVANAEVMDTLVFGKEHYIKPIIDGSPEFKVEMTGDFLKNMPTTSLEGALKKFPNIYSRTDNGPTNTMGSRINSEATYLDGFRVPGGFGSFPSTDVVENLSVTFTGIPAKFGDVTSAVIEITTKSFF